MKFRNLFTAGASAIAAGLLAVGCGGSSGGGDGDSTGTASFSVVDAPVDDATSVVVTFDKIQLKPQGGERVVFELDEPKTIDLLDHQGANDELVFEDVQGPAGNYNFIELFLIDGTTDTEGTNGSFVDDSMGRHELFVPGNENRDPSAPRNPLKLVSGFTIAAGGHTDFVIDFELRKALTNPEGQDHYFLRPALRLIDKLETGTIEGTVSSTLLAQDHCGTSAAVYLYDLPDAAPGDVWVDDKGNSLRRDDAAEDDPLALAEVDATNQSYQLGFVEARDTDYTVAFTCQADSDEPTTDDAIQFDEQHNVNVNANETTTRDFGTD